MMRLALLICSVLTGPAANAAGLVLDGPAFTATNASVVWNAPTNRWPTNLWIYKVAPQEFSPTVISNLMALGDFTRKDRTHVEGQPPFKNKRMLYFANKERTRHLGIFPPYGWLYYRDEKVNLLGKESARGVPTEAESFDLAVKWLDKLEIDRDDLVKKENSSELQAYRYRDNRRFLDRTEGKQKEQVILRAVSFVRQIDGVSFTGRGSDGGFTISFGNEGKIVSLELLWRKLQRHKLSRVATPAEIINRIKKGEAPMMPMSATDLSKAKKLTVDKITPYYLGEDGETLQEFVYPFAAIECTVESEGGAVTRTILKCPILSE